jgi:hypothetical protein
MAIRYEDFLEMWKRADFLTVWLYPAKRIAPHAATD